MFLHSFQTASKGFKKPLGSLTAQEKQKIYENFTGYDISPDMVRLSLVNLYLHGFVKPQIHEYDSLASEERWNEYADVILANPPFMSPKGGIMPHKKFSVQSNRSEVLFVDYMAEHLTPTGRAAIIVPEGIIFQSAGAYKQLRKYLIEHNFLWAVVSLPAGVFNPYAGVKTSILFLDKSLAKKTDKVLFVKVENDGFDLGAQRRPIDRNDLPQTLKVLKEYQQYIHSKTLRVSFPSDSLTVKKTLRVSDDNTKTLKVSTPIKDLNDKETFRVSMLDDENHTSFALETDTALLVSISKLAETDDYNLSADRYREVIRVGKQTYPMVKLGAICETSSGGTPLRSKNEYYENGTIPWLKSGEVAQGYVYNAEEKITELGLKNSSAKIFPVNTVLVAMYGATAGQVGILKIEATTNQAICGIFPNEKIIPEFLYLLLKSQTDYLVSISSGGAQPNISQAVIRNLQIPLPPLETQRQLVDEIAAHQRIIDGARQVVENWKPDIEIDPTWETNKLGDVCDVKSGGTPSKDKPEYWRNGNIPWYSSGELNDFYTIDSKSKITEAGLQNSNVTIFPKGSLLVGMYDTAAFKMSILDRKAAFNQAICGIKPNSKIDLSFLYLYFLEMKEEYLIQRVGIRQRNLSKGFIEAIEIPLPPLEVQREIVARIETERVIVHGNRELIRLYEEKVKKAIERVWEG